MGGAAARIARRNRPRGVASALRRCAGTGILKLAGAPLGKELRGGNLAVFVVAEAADGYRVVYSLAEFDSGFRDATILVADKKDGKALATEEGPLRIVVPGEKRQGCWTRQLTALKLGKSQ